LNTLFGTTGSRARSCAPRDQPSIGLSRYPALRQKQSRSAMPVDAQIKKPGSFAGLQAAYFFDENYFASFAIW
jgi:hypothetical protein